MPSSLPATPALDSLASVAQAVWLENSPLTTESVFFWYFLYSTIFFLFYLFSSPFTGNRELRNRWSGYVYLSTVSYVWLGAAVAVHLPVFHFQNEQTKIPISMFSPLFLASSVTQFLCEGLLKPLNRWFVFHTGWRKNSLEVFQNSIIVSIACCLVYNQCGLSSSASFDSSSSSTAATVCAALFVGRLHPKFAHLPGVLVLWSTAMSIIVINFAFERLSLYRGVFVASSLLESAMPSAAASVNTSRASTPTMDKKKSKINDDNAGSFSPLDNSNSMTSPASASPHSSSVPAVHSPVSANSPYWRRLTDSARARLFSPAKLDMVPWYAIMTAYGALDLLIHLGLFLGRFDQRTLQAAMPNSYHYIENTQIKTDKAAKPLALSASVSAFDSPVDQTPSGFGSRSRDSSSNSLASLSHSSSYRSLYNMSGSGLGQPGLAQPQVFPSSAAHVHRHHVDQPFFYDHLSAHKDVWFDFMSDCGDGWNSSYQIARLLAQPELRIMVRRRSHRKPGMLTLPRGRLLIIGGDLAYPNPSEESYENRFFGPFQCAMAPPLHYEPAAVSVRKPELPDGLRGLLHYDGPQMFAIPGNHDWFDGLQTYLRFIVSRDWLGGWLMPQEKSWFAIALPHSWWIFGIDNALSEDMDTAQFKYFANIANTLGPDARVIFVAHEPDWIINAHENANFGSNIHYLMRLLKGKVALRLAGDIHNYTRHMPGPDNPAPVVESARNPLNAAKAGGVSGGLSGYIPLVLRSARGVSKALRQEEPGWSLFGLVNCCRRLMKATGEVHFSTSIYLEDILNEFVSPVGVGQLARTQSMPDIFQAPDESARATPRASPLKQALNMSAFMDSPLATPEEDDANEPHARKLAKSQQNFSSPALRLFAQEPSAGKTIFNNINRSAASAPSASSAAAPAPAVSTSTSSSVYPPTVTPLSPHPLSHPPPVALALPASVGSWSVHHVSSWLASLGLQQFAQSFRDNFVDGRLLLGLDSEDLMGELRIESALMRKKLIIEIDCLREREQANKDKKDRERDRISASVPAPLSHSVSADFIPSSFSRLHSSPGVSRISPVDDEPLGPLARTLSGDPVHAKKRTAKKKKKAARPLKFGDAHNGAAKEGGQSRTMEELGGIDESSCPPTPPPASSASLPGDRVTPPVCIVSGGGGAFMHPTHVPNPGPIEVNGQQYIRACAYPSVATSRAYALLNIFGFRKRNWRFDLIGGFIYIFLVYSRMPICNLDHLLSSPTLTDLILRFYGEIFFIHIYLFQHAYFSLFVFLALLVILWNFNHASWPLWKKLIVGTLHCLSHTLAAFSVLVFMEACMELGLKRGIIGDDNLYHVFTAAFPAVNADLALADSYTYGLTTALIKLLMGLFDIPDGMANLKTDMCTQPQTMTRLAVLLYYATHWVYLWVLATPLVSFIMGSYLYIGSTFLNAHMTEAFSSLRIESYKNFVRCHVNAAGDLEIYSLGVDRCPRKWVKDPNWSGFHSAAPSHQWRTPSLWRPAPGQPDRVRLIDYLVINKYHKKGNVISNNKPTSSHNEKAHESGNAST